ncbi:MAG: hypothetical protein JXX28_07910 [Deltaproteobacteria bacterium]|nr:hypothetical protein [Deltaproteobacteria bacterium]
MRSWAWIGVLGLIACDRGCNDDPEAGTHLQGEPCTATSQCETFTACTGNGVCDFYGEVGTAGLGEACASSLFCQIEYACSAEGLCAPPGSEGTGSFGDSCEGEGDCQASLRCEEGACAGVPIPAWAGGACEQRGSDEGPLRIYYQVPRSGTSGDFFRLPFPNDLRVDEDEVDLTGFPDPGVQVDAVGGAMSAWITAASWSFSGFGTQAPVFFRASTALDLGDLSVGPVGHGTTGIVDLTPGPAFGQYVPAGMRAATARQAYLCYNWVAVFPTGGRPLTPGHTYAAYLTTSITTKDNQQTLAQDADFTALVAAEPPSDAALAAAWTTYAPLRTWLDGAGLTGDQLAAAAVFTVQDPLEPARQVLSAVEHAPLPEVSQRHLCGEDPGPLAGEDPTRGCFGAGVGYDELQGEVGLPRFQSGTPPYKTAAEGGRIEVLGAGPAPVGTDTVAFALTLPHGDMPAQGWPLVLYAHGEGGNYRSFVAEGLAADLSSALLDDGREARFAVLSIDGLFHGPRVHAENHSASWLAMDPSAYHPARLFLNPLNPWSSMDNPIQGAADYWALSRWAEDMAWSPSESPTGAEVRFDPDRLYFVGRGQGADVGLPFAALEPRLRAAVLAAPRGHSAEVIANTTQPTRLATDVAVVTADPSVDRTSAAVGLMQQVLERGDGANYLDAVLTDDDDAEGRSVLHLWGLGDGWAPDEAQLALARSGSLSVLTNGSEAPEGLVPVTAPVSGNRAGVTGVVSLGAVAPDPHLTLFDDALARRQAVQFLATAELDDLPVVVGP